jgi:Kef-type K+ transport system membrane component KefB/mannitol/fructose-specific phosphotransferase system IIA component (Ntr-type)
LRPKAKTIKKAKSMKRILAVLVFLVTAGNALAGEAAGTHGGSITERMMFLALQLGIIMFATRIGKWTFGAMKLPGVLGELVSGMIIGPFAFGGIRLPGLPDGIFPIADALHPISPELYAFGAIAAIILLFDAGLETDLKMLMRYSLAGTLVGIGGIAVAFASGAWITAVMSPYIIGEQIPFSHPICLFMGVISTATSVGITARILSEKRQLDSPEGVTIISAAIVDDVLGIILLAVVLGIVGAATGGDSVNWGHVTRIGIKALGIWLIASAIGILASRRIGWLLKRFREPTAIAVMALGLALILAAVFEHAGLAMIIGAYVMGVSLSQTDIRHLIREHLEPVHAFLVPVFFCVSGMLINIQTIMTPSVLLFGLVFTLVGFLAKVIGCGIPSFAANFNMLGASRIGVGMVPRGEVGLIIAAIGTSVALSSDGSPLPPQLFASVVLMVMLSTVIAPPLLSRLMQIPHRGTRKLVDKDSGRESITFALASETMADFFLEKLREVFRQEGFFWHCIDRESHLFQLRRDTTIIDLAKRQTELDFLVQPAHIGLIRNMMLEASASFDDALRSLQQPFDTKTLSQGILAGTETATPQHFTLAGTLTERHIQMRLRGSTKAEIYEELLDLLHAQGDVKDREPARLAIWEREQKMSTALEAGIAIPHGKTDAVNKLVCAVGIARDGIDCASMDGEPSRIFVMTLSPKTRTAPHMQFMATITQLLSPAGRMFILEAQTPADILAYLTGQTAPVARRILTPPPNTQMNLADWLTPADMLPALQSTTPTSAIHEMLTHLSGHRALTNIDELMDGILKREQQMPTVMGDNIALPHLRTHLVDKLLCVVGQSRSGIDFNSDGEPETNLIFLVLAPENATKPYMQFVAALFRRVNGHNRAALLAADSPEAMWKCLCEETPPPKKH